MRFGLLGALTVVDDAGVPRPIASGKQRALLAALLLRANAVVSRDELVDALWGEEPPPNALAALRLYVTRLRRALGDGGDGRITGSSAGYLVELAEPAELDLLEVEQLWRGGQEALRLGRHERAVELLRRAEALWRGAALSDVPSDLLRRRESTRLEELRLQITEARIDADLALGRVGEAVAELRSLVEAHPLRERLHAQLMLALYRAERRGEALAAYRDARRVLRDQLGAEPTEQLRELHQRILAADPELNPRPAASPTPPATPPPTPRELPPDTASFTGRTAELDQLDNLLAHAGKQPTVIAISAISGTAGVGKTALAVHWAHVTRRREPDPFPDGCLYLDLRGFDPAAPMTPHDALAAALRSLGLADDAVPDTLPERAARYRSLLDDRRMLLLLDNARDSEQVRPLLPGSPTCLALVTSRDDLAGLVVQHGAHPVPLDLLSPEEALGLLRRLLGDRRLEAEPEAAEALAEHCARLPLALRIAAAHAVIRPGRTLAAIARDLADEHRRLDLLRAGTDPRTTVRAVFSWSLTHHTVEQTRAFRLLGLHPGRDLDDYAAAALLGVPLAEARDHLDILTRAHLIQTTMPGRYSMHDLLRSYAREQAISELPEPERRAAVSRLLDHYLHTAATAMDTLYPAEQHRRPRVPAPGTPSPEVDVPDVAHAWLSAEHANLMATAAHAAREGKGPYLRDLSTTLARHLDKSGRCLDAVAVYDLALEAARAAGDRAGEIKALGQLGAAYISLARHTEAIDRLRQALALARETGDRAGELNALQNLGTNHWRLGQAEDALDCYQRSLSLACETGDRVSESNTRVNLGALHHELGRYPEAAEQYRKALPLAREIGHHVVETIALNNLGETHHRLGDYAQALDSSRQALAHARATGNRVDEGNALVNIGMTHQSLGEHASALDDYQQALTLARDMGNRTIESYTLLYLGVVHLSLGAHSQALDLGRQALALAQEIGNTHVEAEARNALGETLRATDRIAEAQDHHTRALTLARGNHNRYQEARALEGLAHTHHAGGAPTRARHHWSQALALYTALGVPEAAALRADSRYAAPPSDIPERGR